MHRSCGGRAKFVGRYILQNGNDYHSNLGPVLERDGVLFVFSVIRHQSVALVNVTGNVQKT